MPDRVLIPLPGIGTLSLSHAEYEAALIPIPPQEVPKAAPPRRAEPVTAPAAAVASKPPGLRYLRLREVCERVGLRQSSIYRLISLGRFPKQVKLSERSAAWVESEVEAYMEARIDERDRQPSVSVSPASPYMRMGEVMRRTGLNSSTIYERIRDGSFPKWADLPKIASGWLKTDIDAWLVSLEETNVPVRLKRKKLPCR